MTTTAIRKHAAIMFTDIVGYTALMGTDEDKAFDALKKNREIHSKFIEQFNGTLIKEMGDGMLISFNLASDAVKCALKIQEACNNHKIPLKIGIHEGEMMFEEKDVFGDSVNIASRIQNGLDQGCIMISGAVYSDIKNKHGIQSNFEGEKYFKNVAEPIKVYKVCLENNRDENKEIFSREQNRNSIAVLPFVNMSNDPEQEYFCDGITEEIINALSHIQSLKVIARTSAFIFKGGNEDIREIGRKLNVENLLEGSVRKAGNRLRITTQLINASDGSHIWSEAYNRPLEDVFAIQEEISLAIADNLEIRLLGKEKKAIEKRFTKNIEAYNLYLKGLFCAHQFTPQGLEKALEYFERSIQLDTQFVLSYYGLAYTFIKVTFFGNMPPKEGYPIAKKYLDKAFEIEENVAEAHATMGTYVECLYNWNFETAEKELNRAREINRNCPEVYHLYSFYYNFTHQHEKAIEAALKATDLDPLSSYYGAFLGEAYLYGRQTEKAIEVLENVVKMAPYDFMARYHLGHTYEHSSRFKEAIKEYELVVEIAGRTPLAVSVLSGGYYLNGEYDKAKMLISELEDRSKSEYVPATMIYSYYKIKGDLDQAYFWLEKAVEERDSFLLYYTVCPTIGHSIPDEPRFQALIEPVIAGRKSL